MRLSWRLDKMERSHDELSKRFRKPTAMCLCAVVICVCFLVLEKNLTKKHGAEFPLYENIDDATSFQWMYLISLLAFSCAGQCWSVLHRTVRRGFLKIYTQNEQLRFLLALIAVLILSVLLLGLAVLLKRVLTPVLSYVDYHEVVVRKWGRSSTSSNLVLPPYRPYRGQLASCFCNDTHYRLESEDVRFECEMKILLPDEPDSYRLVHILSSPRGITNLSRDSDKTSVMLQQEVTPQSEEEWENRYSMHSLKITVYLPRLSEEDFGIYFWHLRIVPREPVFICQADIDHPAICSSQHTVFIASFTLIKWPITVEEFYVPLGGVVTLKTDYWAEEYNPGDILVEHRFNGQLFDIFLQNSKEFCSPDAQILHYIVRTLFDIDIIAHSQSYRMWEGISVGTVIDEHILCFSPEMYGVLKTNVSRIFYNPKTKAEDFVEIQFPLIAKIAPSYAGLFGNVRESADRSFFQDCWEDTQPVISEYCSLRSKKLISELHSRHLKICCSNIVFLLTFIFFVITVCEFFRNLLSSTFWLIFKGSCIAPVMNTLTHAVVDWNLFRKQRTKLARYDVFLSYDISEMSLDLHCLVTTIFQTFNLRVFDCHLSPEPGEPSLASWDRAITESASFVILASRNYATNPEMALLFRSMHFLVLSNEIPEERMLIISTEERDIPRTLGSLPIIPWHGRCCCLKNLVWWAGCLARCPDGTPLWRQLVQDFKRHYRYLLYSCQFACDKHRHRTFSSKNYENVCFQQFIKPVRRKPFQDGRIKSRSVTANEEGSSRGSCSSIRQTHCLTVEGRESASNSHDDETECCDNPYGKEHAPLGGTGFRLCDDTPDYDIFLTYCEDSVSDCDLADKLKKCLEMLHLRVFDAVRDVLGYEVEQEGIAAAVSRSSSFVVLLSPAYRTHPLTRRLHFTQILHAVETRRVSVDDVLLIRTGFGCLRTGTDISLQSTGSPKNPLTLIFRKPGIDDRGSDSVIRNVGTDTSASSCIEGSSGHQASISASASNDKDTRISKHISPSDGPLVASSESETANGEFEHEYGEEQYGLHEGLRVFPIINWTGGLADEDYLRQVELWGRSVLRRIRREKRRDFEELQRQYLAQRVERQHVMTVSRSLRHLFI